MSEVQIKLNGERRKVPPGQTVTALVAALGEDVHGGGLAVALNNEVVPRTAWTLTEVCDGDSVEVVRAIRGG